MNPKFTFVRVKRVKDTLHGVIAKVQSNSPARRVLDTYAAKIKTDLEANPVPSIHLISNGISIAKAGGGERLRVPFDVAALTLLLIENDHDPAEDGKGPALKIIDKVLGSHSPTAHAPLVVDAQPARPVVATRTPFADVDADAPLPGELVPKPVNHDAAIYALLNAALELSKLNTAGEESIRRGSISAAMVLYRPEPRVRVADVPARHEEPDTRLEHEEVQA